jgi:hypothetical protein
MSPGDEVSRQVLKNYASKWRHKTKLAGREAFPNNNRPRTPNQHPLVREQTWGGDNHPLR